MDTLHNQFIFFLSFLLKHINSFKNILENFLKKLFTKTFSPEVDLKLNLKSKINNYKEIFQFVCSIFVISPSISLSLCLSLRENPQYQNPTSVALYNPSIIRTTIKLKRSNSVTIKHQSSCFSLSLDNTLRKSWVLYESYKRAVLETMGCSMVNVNQGEWIQKQVNSLLSLDAWLRKIIIQWPESNSSVRKLLLFICKGGIY